MKIRSDLRVFAGDESRQMHLLQYWRDAIAEWQSSEQGQKIETLFAEAAPYAPANALPILQPLLDDTGWLTETIAIMMRGIEHDVFFNPSIPKMRNEILDGLILAENGQLTLSLSVLDHQKLRTMRNAAQNTTKIVSFSAGNRVLKFVKAGGLRISEFRLSDGSLGDEPICELKTLSNIADGDMIVHDNDKQTLYFESADSDALILQILFKSKGAYVREFDGVSGKPCMVATHDDATARVQMMLGLLEVLKPQGAETCFEAVLKSPADDQRWQAMRQFLAYDARPAIGHLQTMAKNDPSDEVRRVAAKTMTILQQSHAHLFAARPQL